MKIKKLAAQQVFDSRGNPTVGCMIELSDGYRVFASVPAGSSCSSFEAPVLRDEDRAHFAGMGVQRAVSVINDQIAAQLVGHEPDVAVVDAQMVRHNQAEPSGANITLAVSIAVIRAQAYIQHKEVCELIAMFLNCKLERAPRCMFNVINGGMHAHNNLAMQEFLVIPHVSLDMAMECGWNVYRRIGEYLSAQCGQCGIGDEGGYAPIFEKKEMMPELQVLHMLKDIIQSPDFEHYHAALGIDAAASTFFEEQTERYMLHGRNYTAHDLSELYKNFATQVPLISIEDGFAQSDVHGWQECFARMGSTMLLIADDLTATHAHRITLAAAEKMCNAVIIKPNQVGTVTETLDAIRAARVANLQVVVSHRSGETEDTFIADLALGAQADFFKAGALVRERVLKYNRLLWLSSLFLCSSR